MSELAKALLAAQKEMPAIAPDSKNQHFKSDFVSLDHLLAKTLPVLNKHGIAVAQFPTMTAEGGLPTLTTVLLHESGEQREYEAPLYLAKTDPQGHGSAITYARRYALAAALGISAEKDDDAEGAMQRSGEGAPEPHSNATTPSPEVLELSRSTKIPAGPHKGQTMLEAYRLNPGYVAQVAEHAGDQKLKAAAQAVIAGAELAAAETTEF